MSRSILTLLALFSFGATDALAHETCHTAFIEQTHCDWTMSTSVPQFNPALGTLTGIRVSMRTKARGRMGIESLDPVAAQATARFSARLVVFDASTNPLVQLNPTTTFVDTFTAFDGQADYRGGSGTFHDAITAIADYSYSPPLDAANLATFVGTGVVPYTVTANRASTITGVNNSIFQYATKAQISIEVCYTYASNGQ